MARRRTAHFSGFLLATAVLATPTALRGDNFLIERTEFVSAPHSILSAQPQQKEEKDGDRGCCVWHTAKKACAYTNRKYCVEKADKQDVSYSFYQDKACKDVAACPDK